MKKIYLAWPSVFKNIDADRLKSTVRDNGFEPLYPLDNEIEFTEDKRWNWRRVFEWNVDYMSKADIFLVDLSWFRGYDSDSWTSFELWFGYANWKKMFWYNISSETMVEKLWENDHDGYHVEDFDWPTNLMLVNSIEMSWWKIYYNDNLDNFYDIFKDAIIKFKNDLKE